MAKKRGSPSLKDRVVLQEFLMTLQKLNMRSASAAINDANFPFKGFQYISRMRYEKVDR